MKQSNLRRPVLAIAALFLVTLLSSGANSAFAQGSSGTVTGSVTDVTGAYIPGASITLVDATTGKKFTATTNKSGEYTVVDVPPGVYNITSSKPGFSTDQVVGETVSISTQTTANFKMAVGSENTTIEVQASTSDLQTMSATVGSTVDPAVVDALPSIGREVSSFMTLQPGVSPSGQVAGTTADQATFTLDGGSNSSDMDGTYNSYTTSFATSTTGGFLGASTQGVVPMTQDSVEEFKVSTTGQTAEFNNSSGSQSQVVTKRGRDTIHGTAYEYYLDNNFNGNTWQGNFPNTATTSYTKKPSYHFSRFGASLGGPIAPVFLGGKTYLFANFEGFRYPLVTNIERDVPSYQYLQQGQLTFGANTYTAAQLTADDPRKIGQNTTLAKFYNQYLPVAPSTNNGSVGATGVTYAGTFDQSCGANSGAVCDGVNIIGYNVNVPTPQKSNFFVTRLDHDFGSKEHMYMSYRYYNLQNTTSNQVDIGGGISGDKVGTPVSLAPRPQQPWFFVTGLTSNITSSLTNDFHYSHLHNFWQWKGAGAPPLVGTTGALEPLGESTTQVLSPYNVNAQSIRTRIWDGKDNFFSDNLSKLKGNHFIQVGGQYQHNFNFHQRTDNGASINYTPTYQIGDGTGGNVAYSATGLGQVIGTSSSAQAYASILDSFYGIVTDTQVANTYANVNGTLTLNPAATPIGAHTTIPYYNLFATDTWRATSSLTLNYGISWALEMPPTERNGNQVMFTDVAGNAIQVDQFLAAKQAAAATGTVYNPEIGFALIHNVMGNRKYPYDPYYAGFSPRLSAAWNPKFKTKFLSKAFGDGGTVIRGGYGRIYGRINGDLEVLNPLLSPGLILATQCKYAQSPTTGSGNCTQSNFNDTSVYRIGTDGTSPALATAALPTTLTQPYHPGFDGPGVSIASPLDPKLRPNDVDTFNLSIQRQINRKMLVEVGYIGRLIHHEYIMKNPNQVPYTLSLGGQTFEAAYDAIETAFGCTSSASLCTSSTTPTASIAAQPFFENALGGATSAYCAAYTSCTAAVVAKQASKFRAQQIFSLWQALDNNVGGANGVGWTFARSLMGTATSNATYGGAGQIVTGLSVGTGDGYSNYNGGYLSLKASNWHGLTAQENLTWSKALGLGAYNQSSSSITAEDSFNLGQQYGRQSFDQKLIFNTFLVYETPWYKSQRGIIGRFAGGWIISPVITAGTGQPLQCVSNNKGQNFGGEDGSTFTDSESCIFTSAITGSGHTTRGVLGGVDPYGVKVGTAYKVPGGSAAVNMFGNPVAVWDTVRPPILGIDMRDGGSGPISGLGYLNMDLSVRKKVTLFERVNVEFTGVMQNVMNHLDFANPSLSLASSTNFGVTKTQGNSPRAIQMGMRASF